MDQYLWILWMILGVILVIAEIFTFGFVLLWFGVGAFAAAVAGLAGAGLLTQFLIFAALSVALTIGSRTIFSNLLNQGGDSMRSGVDSLPGQVGTVTIASQGALGEGAVKVYGSVWTAYPADGESKFIEGEKVEVVSVKGSSIYVRRAVDELPGWRNG